MHRTLQKNLLQLLTFRAAGGLDFTLTVPFFMTLSIICALDQAGAIGNKGGLLFRLPADLKRFKALTTGHTVLMGRKTFESLPKGALPNRRNVVITRQKDYSAPNIDVFHSFEDALASCGSDEEVYIIGGESVYREALPAANRLCLTLTQATAPEADTYFPTFNKEEWTEVAREHHEADEKHAVPFDFVDYCRR